MQFGMNPQIGNYFIERDLFLGEFTKECLVQSAITGEYFMMRIYDKYILHQCPGIERAAHWEQQVLSQVQSSSSLLLYEGLESSEAIFSVMTLTSGETVLERIHQVSPFQENLVRIYLIQLLDSLSELHRYEYLPRVITNGCFKLLNENLVVDFYGAERNQSLLNGNLPLVYTTESPESLQFGVSHNLDQCSEIWSIGVCLYEMLFGVLPWQPYQDSQKFLDLIMNFNGENLPFPQAPKVSQPWIDLLKKMLTADRRLRMTWQELTSHPLVLDQQAKANHTPQEIENLKSPEDLNDNSFTILDDVNQSLFSSMIVKTVINRESVSHPDSLNQSQSKDLNTDEEWGDEAVRNRMDRYKKEGPISGSMLKKKNEATITSLTDEKIVNHHEPMKSPVLPPLTNEIMMVNKLTKTPRNHIGPQSPNTDRKFDSPYHKSLEGKGDDALKQGNGEEEHHPVPRPSYATRFDSACKYRHEQRIVYFCLETIDDLEGMASILQSEGRTGDYWQGYHIVAGLLAKSCLDRQNMLIQSIEGQQNVFSMPDFANFIRTPDTRLFLQELVRERISVGNQLDTISTRIQDKSFNNRIVADVLPNLSKTSPRLDPNLLVQHIVWLFSFFLDFKLNFEGHHKQEIRKLLARLFMCSEAEQEFRFLNSGKVFDWSLFERLLNDAYLLQTYDLATQWYMNARDYSFMQPMGGGW